MAALIAPYAGAYAAGAYAAGPAVVAPAPAAVAASLAAPSSQFHAQDELGNVNYGYANVNSAKQEVGNAYGGVTGSYSYVDANGIPQRVDYIADGLGFRVRATNLPVAPATPVVPELKAAVYNGVAPAPVVDTPEVAAAKAEFFAKFEEAKNRNKRSVVGAYNALPYATAGYYGNVNAYGLGLNGYGLGLNGYGLGLNAYGYNLGAPALAYNAPAAVAAAPAVAYSAPAVAPAAREAVLTTIKLNPGHAVAYRVD